MFRWNSVEVVWGVTLCARKSCARLAECLFDGEPLCLEDAVEAVERVEAVGIYPSFREILPDWNEA